MNIDIDSWPRLREVQIYAYDRGIPVSQAIEELVNKGLSNE